MAQADSPPEIKSYLGTTIKLLRIRRNITGKELAGRVGVSPSLISKIERGATNPSTDVLRKISMALHVSLADLMDPNHDLAVEPALHASSHRRGRVSLVRPHERKLLTVPRSGLTYELLTADMQHSYEFVYLELAPGEGGKEVLAHESGEESVLVLSGTLEVMVDDERYELAEGDCLTLDATLPHRYRNAGDVPVRWLYLAVPPTL